MLSVTELLEHYHVVRQTFAPLRLTRWQLTKLMAAQLWREASPLAKTVFVTIVTSLLLLVASLFRRRSSLQRLNLPRAVKSRRSGFGLTYDFRQVMEDTAKKYPDSPFLLTAFGVEYVIFPSVAFDEIKRLPVTQASAFAFFREVFHAPWTGAGVQTPDLGKYVVIQVSK
jgi:gliotoxin biosynthesis cytochrome P450 monooxygenase